MLPLVRRRLRTRSCSLLGLLLLTTTLAAGAVVAPAPPASAAPESTYAGLAVTSVVTGLSQPVAARFAPDGKIYVAEKSGLVKSFDGAGDTTATETLDLRDPVNSDADRGLLGIALDPAFTTGRPYLYALYTWNKEPFTDRSVPRWAGDGCPDPPGVTTDGCPVSAKLARYAVDPAIGVADPASERVLLDGAGASGGWCNQFSSHSIGTVEFGPDGMLYVGSGDGASFTSVDYGQFGASSAQSPTPKNPCADGVPRGTEPPRATSIGGALRSQAVREATAGGYVTWDGSILRVDPATGLAPADNPLVGNGRAGDDRIVAFGLRNPLRFAFRPGTTDLWLGDVGWGSWEEVNTFATGPGQRQVPNFGWPCYEGTGQQSSYATAGLGLCQRLYASTTSNLGGVTSPLAAPHFAWPRQGEQPAAGCATSGGGSATGGIFVDSPAWPEALRGAYLFADYTRGCIVAMPLTNGQPDPSRRVRLVSGATAVQFVEGPGDDVYFVDIATGSLNRIRSTASNLAPSASFTATPDSGPAPLTVTVDAAATRDPNGDAVTFAWDLDGDGACDDATGVRASRQYTAAGDVTVKLCATDQLGLTGTATRVVAVGRSAPRIDSLTSSGGWAVGQTITLVARASDADEALPDSAFTWAASIAHCESPAADDTCHSHPLSTLPAGRSTTVAGPDHDYYAYLSVELSVRDSTGLVTRRTIKVEPRISQVELRTEPSGIPVSVADGDGTSPFAKPMLEGGGLQLGVPATATVGGVGWTFAGWSDGSAAGTLRQGRTPPGSSVFTAVYRPTDPGPTDPGPTDPGPTDPGPTDPGPPEVAGEQSSIFTEQPSVVGGRGRVLVGDFAGTPADDVLMLRGRRSALWVAQGGGDFRRVVVRAPAGSRSVVADLVGDGRDEVLLHGRDGRARLWRLDGQGRGAERVRTRIGAVRVPISARATVLDHRRGHDALLWSGPGPDRLTEATWRGSRVTLRGPQVRVPGAARATSADLDGDGLADLVLTRSGRAQDQVWLTRRRGGVSAVADVRRLRVPATGPGIGGRFEGTRREQVWFRRGGRDVLVSLRSGRTRVSRPDVDVTGRALLLPGRRDALLVVGATSSWVVSLAEDGAEALEASTEVPGGATPVTGDFDGTVLGDVLWLAGAGPARLDTR